MFDVLIILFSTCFPITDIPVFTAVLQEAFPGSAVAQMDDEKAGAEIVAVCNEHKYVPADSFIQKTLQLKQVIEMRHGVMIVGKSGKSAATRVLLKVLEKLDDIKGELYVIDPKAMSKDQLYGTLDGTTLEWVSFFFRLLIYLTIAIGLGLSPGSLRALCVLSESSIQPPDVPLTYLVFYPY